VPRFGRLFGGLDLTWKLLLAWFALSLGIFAVAGSIRIVEYEVVFVGLFGSLALLLRRSVRPALRRVKLDNVWEFAMLAVLVSSLEELVVYAVGGSGALAQSTLGVDLLWVDVIWLGWMLPWYLWLASRYAFSSQEALLVGGTAGILFEVLLSRIFVEGPVIILLWIPLVWVTYSVVLLLPLELTTFKAPPSTARRWLAGVAIPWVSATCVALLLWLILSVVGIPLK
jgi:hypothetical protein